MKVSPILVVLGLACMQLACSSSSSSAADADGGDPGLVAPGGDIVGTDTNPYGVPYPTANIGYQARRGAAAGNVMPNYKFLGYPDGDTSKGLQPVSLANYLDPEMRKYKVLHISAAGSWCYWCQQEAIAAVAAKQELADMHVAYLTTLTEGTTQGVAATNQDLLNWMANYSINYTHVLDPGNHNLAAFFQTAGLPWNANLDARTMEILDSSSGASTNQQGQVDIIGDVKTWTKWVDTHPIK